jgi:hypothetical protein
MGYKIMQIETSNHCSLTCTYCPHPSQVRPKGFMSMETFMKCMELVKRSENPSRNGRKFIWLNHFGEPLLNPILPDFISYAKSCGIEVSFATNGVDRNRNLFPRSLWKQLGKAGLKGVILSAHIRSEEVLREHIKDIVKVIGVWTPKKENFHDWAGQVNMSGFKIKEINEPDCPCDYNTNNMFVVAWDGRLTSCCYDIEGQVGLSVDNVLENDFLFHENSLCAGCRLGRGDVSWILDPLIALHG